MTLPYSSDLRGAQIAADVELGNNFYIRTKIGGTYTGWDKIIKNSDFNKDLGTESLNNITSFGDYAQRKANDATIARNYPTPDAGMLEVRPFEGGNWIYQRYTAQNGAIYNRKKYNGSWSDWK